MAFPPGFLDELRSRISLADLVGRRVRLVRRGREHSGLCPFHNEKTPSFYVVEDKGFFHCFGCGAHGDAIGFVMRADNLDFIEAVERLAGEAGIAVPHADPAGARPGAAPEDAARSAGRRGRVLRGAAVGAGRGAGARVSDPARSRRGDDPAVPAGLGAARTGRRCGGRSASEFPGSAAARGRAACACRDEGGSPYDYFRGRVMFPIGDRAGRIIAFGGRTLGDGQPKYLNSPDTPVFEKGRILYGWAAARANIAREPDGTAVIVVEGYMDVIALHRAGFGGAVAPLGTALTETQLHELWRLAPEPVLCFDGDAAGQRAALRALARALPLLHAGPQSALRGAARRRGPGFADPQRRARHLPPDPRGRLSAVRDAVAAPN